MAEALTIQGLPIRVVKDTWKEQPILYQGGRVRVLAGNIIDTHDPLSAKRIADCQVYWLTRAEETTFRGVSPIGTAVAVGGDLPGEVWTAYVTIGEASRNMADNGGSLHWVAACHIEEA